MYGVLIVDDEPWIMIGLKKLINWEAEGFQIIGEAMDGEKAWEKVTCMSPDLIISDIRMPKLNGLALLDRIRKNGITTSVIFVSGYSDFEYARSSIRLGCSDYLLKPVNPEELIKALRSVRQNLDAALNQEPEGYISDHVIVREVMHYLSANYVNPMMLSELAQKYRFSTGYFSGLIKKKTGKSYSEHLMNIRVKKAKELLSGSNKSIQEIAEEVGYDDYFYFTRVYKKIEGISASAYRKTL